MAIQDEINALRRLMESINKLSASNSASIGKLSTEQLSLRAELTFTRQLADRAIQLCNDLSKRLEAVEKPY